MRPVLCAWDIRKSLAGWGKMKNAPDDVGRAFRDG